MRGVALIVGRRWGDYVWQFVGLLQMLVLLFRDTAGELVASWRIESRVLSATDLLLVWLKQGCALASGLVCSRDEGETVYIMIAEQWL